MSVFPSGINRGYYCFYEPIWSIGTGLIPSSEDILEVNNFVKKYLNMDKKIKKVSFL